MPTERNQCEEGLIPEGLALLVRFCSQNPYLVLAVTLLTCAASLTVTATELKFLTQRDDLISQQKAYRERWQKFVDLFGEDDDLVVVFEGKNRKEMESAINAVAEKIKQQPELFDRLFYRVDLTHLKNRSLMYLPAQDIAKIQHGLKGHEKLFFFAGIINLEAWRNLTLSNLVLEARLRIIDLLPTSKLEDSDGLFRQLKHITDDARTYLQNPDSYKSPWISVLEPAPGEKAQEERLEKPIYFFNGDGSLAYLLARPKLDKASFTSAEKNVHAMEAIIAEVMKDYPGLTVGLTGLPVLEYDEMSVAQEDSMNASWIALGCLAILFYLVFGKIRYPLAGIATLAVGAIWSLGWTTVTVGHLNILSMAFGVMLIGMGNFGILWVTRFLEERLETHDRFEAMERTARTVGPSILTAAVTTSLAFFATMFADLKAVTELGWIAGFGVLFCALSCYTVLPALLTIFDTPPRARQAEDAMIYSMERQEWLPWLTHRPWVVLPTMLLLCIGLSIAALGNRYDHNLLNLQNQNLASVKWQFKLLNRAEGATWHALSYTQTREEALRRKAEFEKLPTVSFVGEVASLIPADQKTKIERMEQLQNNLKNLPPRGKIIDHAMPSVKSVLSNLQRVRTSIEGLEDPRFQPLVDSMKALEDEIRNKGKEAAPLLKRFNELITRDLADNLYRLKEISTPEPITEADVPMPLRQRLLGKQNEFLLRIFPKHDLWEFPALKEFCEEVQTVDSEATGKPFSTMEGLRAMKDGFTYAAFYALIAIVMLLLLDFGNVYHAALALGPLLMGVACTLGLMTLFGVPRNPANMIAFPLILGVGVDNGVHVLHDYCTRHRDHTYSLNFATGRGILVTGLTTILGFGTLMISRHQGQASLGLVLTIGVTSCLVTALIFLPTVLRLLSLRHQSNTELGTHITTKRA